MKKGNPYVKEIVAEIMRPVDHRNISLISHVVDFSKGRLLIATLSVFPSRNIPNFVGSEVDT